MKERVDKLDQLADFIIDDLLKVAREGNLTSADRKIILDFLRQNGLNLDPNSIPDDVKALLTSKVSFDGDDNDAPLKLAK